MENALVHAVLARKKRPRTVLCWAEAFKAKEEEEDNFERVSMIHQRVSAGVDKNHKERGFAANACEMSNQSA